MPTTRWWASCAWSTARGTCWWPRTARTRDRLWEARRMIIEALKHDSPINHMEDVVVPRAEIPELLEGIKEIAAGTPCASSASAMPATATCTSTC